MRRRRGRPAARAPAALKVSRPLVCTDTGLVATGLVDTVAGTLTDAVIFDGTPANPTEDAVMAALALYREKDCDGIVGFGGGSSLDLAKAVRLLTGHEPPLAQYTAINGGSANIHGDIAPLIAIPTTAGTGSEVGCASVIIGNERSKLTRFQRLNLTQPTRYKAPRRTALI